MTTRGWVIAGIAIAALAAAVTWGIVLLFAESAAPAAASDPPRFVVEDTAAGIHHVYDGEFTFFVGGGVALFDCSDDGKPDVYLAGGANPAALYRNDSPVSGSLRFAEVARSGTEITEVTGAYPIDIDADGVTDLAVLRLGENVLFRGLGDCRFERANEAWGFDGGDDWTAGFSAKWEGAAELPTLAFGNYVALDELGQQTEVCSDNFLLRPGERGYAAPQLLTPGWCALSVLFSDWDRSGRSDLRITNDRHFYRDGEEQLWRVGEGEPPRLYARDEGWKKLQIWGMGIASHDVTGDGLPEFFLTSQGDNKLRTLTDGADQPSYRDIAIRSGVTAHRPYAGEDVMPSTAWHPEFRDVNNDTFVDLFISKGNVEAMPEFATNDPSNLLIGQPDGTFVEGGAAAGIVSFARARGAALADFNLDGLLDLIEVNRRENVKVWRNVGSGTSEQTVPMGRWIAIRSQQQAPNRDAVGAWIEVRVGDRMLGRELTVGGGHAGGQLGWIHFGLGDAEVVEARVQWPDGDLGPWLEVRSNQFIIIERGAETAQVWVPPAG